MQVIRCDYSALLSAFLLFQDVISTIFGSGKSNALLKRRSATGNSLQRPENVLQVIQPIPRRTGKVLLGSAKQFRTISLPFAISCF